MVFYHVSPHQLDLNLEQSQSLAPLLNTLPLQAKKRYCSYNQFILPPPPYTHAHTHNRIYPTGLFIGLYPFPDCARKTLAYFKFFIEKSKFLLFFSVTLLTRFTLDFRLAKYFGNMYLILYVNF